MQKKRMSPATALAAFIPVLAAVAADGFMSAVGFASILGANNYIAWVFALIAGILTTGFVVATRYVVTGAAPKIFWLPWFACVLLDAYTTLACADHFVIRRLGFDRVAEIAIEFSSPVQAGITLAITVAIFLTAMSAPWVYESLPD